MFKQKNKIEYTSIKIKEGIGSRCSQIVRCILFLSLLQNNLSCCKRFTRYILLNKSLY